MPKKTDLEFQVGLFVLAALVGLTFVVFSITDSSVFAKGQSIKVIFNFANGLKKNAPVRIAGVEEGVVKDIGLFFDHQEKKTKAEVMIWINNDVRVPEDSIVTINQLGLLGEKYVEIVPGRNMEYFFQEGQPVIGKDPIAQEAISEKVLEVAHKLDQSIDGVNKILTDERNHLSISDMLNNLSAVTGSVKDILAHVQAGQGSIGHILYDDRLYNDLTDLTGDIKDNPWKLLYRPN